MAAPQSAAINLNEIMSLRLGEVSTYLAAHRTGRGPSIFNSKTSVEENRIVLEPFVRGCVGV